jgi:hypothetical protein
MLPRAQGLCAVSRQGRTTCREAKKINSLRFWYIPCFWGLVNTKQWGVMLMRKKKLVMVGNGMAGVRTLEELLKIAPE